VRVVPRWQLTLDRLARYNRAAPTLGIIASGQRKWVSSYVSVYRR